METSLSVLKDTLAVYGWRSHDRMDLYWLLIASSGTWCGCTSDITTFTQQRWPRGLSGRTEGCSISRQSHVWVNQGCPSPSSSFRSPINICSVWIRKPGNKARRKRTGKESVLLFTSSPSPSSCEWKSNVEQVVLVSNAIFCPFFRGGLCRKISERK